MWRVGCVSTRRKVWNALCVSGDIAYSQYVQMLRDMVLRSDDTPRYREMKAKYETGLRRARRPTDEEDEERVRRRVREAGEEDLTNFVDSLFAQDGSTALPTGRPVGAVVR